MDLFTLFVGMLAAVTTAGVGVFVASTLFERAEQKLVEKEDKARLQQLLEAPNRPIVDAIVASIRAHPDSWVYDAGRGDAGEQWHVNPALFTGKFTIVYSGSRALPWGITFPLRAQFTMKEATEVQQTWEIVCADKLLDGALS